jgi:hypothetical protein
LRYKDPREKRGRPGRGRAAKEAMLVGSSRTRRADRIEILLFTQPLLACLSPARTTRECADTSGDPAAAS